jgi:hypothetical protein
MSSRIVFASFPFVAFALTSACGGATLSGGLYQDGGSSGDDGGATHEDAGTHVPPGTPTPGRDGGTTLKDASTGVSCLTSSDCSTGEECAWPTSEDYCVAFNPAGTCVKPVVEPCQVIIQETGCGCDGVNVTWTSGCSGLPMGYAPQGLLHAGACTDGGAVPPVDDAGDPPPLDDGGTRDTDASTGTPCASNNDCPVGQQCGYEKALMCSATAQCEPAEDFGLCNCEMPACFCDGTTGGVPCCGTYSPKPLAPAGSCATDGGF